MSKTKQRKWLDKHPDYKKQNYARVKNAAYALLGEVCVVCGFSDRRALQIDHKNGGGGKEFEEIGTLGIYRRVLVHPDDYQILCCNHNWIKRHENGELPSNK